GATSPDAGMDAALGGEVYEFGGLASGACRGLDDAGRGARDGDNGAVVSRVEGPVEQAYSFDLHGSDDLGDLADVGAFREIGDTLDYGFWTHVLLPPTVAEGE